MALQLTGAFKRIALANLEAASRPSWWAAG